jgi:hypothetical protein
VRFFVFGPGAAVRTRILREAAELKREAQSLASCELLCAEYICRKKQLVMSFDRALSIADAIIAITPRVNRDAIAATAMVRHDAPRFLCVPRLDLGINIAV